MNEQVSFNPTSRSSENENADLNNQNFSETFQKRPLKKYQSIPRRHTEEIIQQGDQIDAEFNSIIQSISKNVNRDHLLTPVSYGPSTITNGSKLMAFMWRYY